MAHFAELESKTDPTGFTSDTHLVVKQVTVVGNDISTAAGPLGENDMHVDGETWCQKFFKGGTWKQTSYNNNFRKMYAGIGMVYNESKDKFLAPQPYASWTLNANDDWEAPVAYPTDKDNTHEDELFQRELTKMREKLENCVAFFDDIDTDAVKAEMLEVLRMIYDYEKETNLLSRAMNKSHIIDQSRYYNKKKQKNTLMDLPSEQDSFFK